MNINVKNYPKILVAVLTSGKPEKLERCLRSVNSNSSPHERIVVINTTDAAYTSQATQIAFDHGFPVHISKSNGLPGMGKNSVLDYFLKSDSDWLLPIDGDDFISDGCLSRLYYEIEKEVFDLGVLVGGRAIRPSGSLIPLKKIHLLPIIVRTALKSYTRKEIEEYIELVQKTYEEFFDGEPLNRTLLLNKNIAKNFRYDETMECASDLLFFRQVKKSKKVHPIWTTVEDLLYLYDFSEDGVVIDSFKNKYILKNLRKVVNHNDK